MRYQKLFEKNNILLFSYILFFAVLCIVYYLLSMENSFYSGISGILLVILYPTGVFFYGYKTGDRFRAPLSGIVSYAFLIFLILLSANFHDFLNLSHLLLFTGYNLMLLICLGLIGFLASGKEKLQLIIAGILSVIWILIFISGIS